MVPLPGTSYTQQSYKVSDSFPFKWINKKWREGFYVTSMATAGSRWAVVMSRNAGFTDQVRQGLFGGAQSMAVPAGDRCFAGVAVTRRSESSCLRVYPCPVLSLPLIRWWSWTSCILVRASTGAGTWATVSLPLLRHGTRQPLF